VILGTAQDVPNACRRVSQSPFFLGLKMDPDTYPVELGYRFAKLAIAMNKKNTKIWLMDKIFILKVLTRYDGPDKQEVIEKMREI